jgi:hypothetical protein
MRFLSMIRVTQDTGRRPSERLLEEMGKLMAQMTAAGVLLDTAGLRPLSEGVRVGLSHGRIKVTDGPFAEAKEVVGGYALLEAASLEEAVEWTRRFLQVHGDEWELECEVRAIDESCKPQG